MYIYKCWSTVPVFRMSRDFIQDLIFLLHFGAKEPQGKQDHIRSDKAPLCFGKTMNKCAKDPTHELDISMWSIKALHQVSLSNSGVTAHKTFRSLRPFVASSPEILLGQYPNISVIRVGKMNPRKYLGTHLLLRIRVWNDQTFIRLYLLGETLQVREVLFVMPQ